VRELCNPFFKHISFQEVCFFGIIKTYRKFMFKKKAKKSKPSPEKKTETKSKSVKVRTKSGYTGGVLVIVIVLLILSLTALAFLYLEYDKLEGKLADPEYLEGLIEKDTGSGEDLLSRVGRHIRLPEGDPQIATVANIDNLVKEQPFFKGAKNGDRVLIYTDKVIVYDEQDDIIVNVGFLLNTPQAATSTAATSTKSTVQKEDSEKVEKLTIEVRNGSTVRGLAGKTRNKIIQDDSFTVTGVANAARSNYEEGVVVDLTDGNKQDLIFKLKDLLGLRVVSELPPGEVASPAEVVVIVVE